MRVFAIDPGPTESAYFASETEHPAMCMDFCKSPNFEVLRRLEDVKWDVVLIERVASMGMAVGEHVFETVFWSGRFAQVAHDTGAMCIRIKRAAVKLHLCGQSRANDANIITAIVDRFDPNREFGKYGKGVKKKPGPFFGFAADVWQAYALYLTYYDTRNPR